MNLPPAFPPIFADERLHLTHRLPDGRVLGYSDAGDPSAAPVFYFHGFPGSRLETAFLPITGARLIGVDRPGYGLSTHLRERTLAGFSKDVLSLADEIGLRRFGVLGISGGAPYAASLARQAPERVSAVALVCGLGPPEAPGMQAGRLRFLLDMGHRPVMRSALLALGRGVVMDDAWVRRATRLRGRMERSSADRALMHGEMGHLMLASWREAMRGGTRGMATDSVVYGRAWGWPVSQIRVPAYLWHGEADVIVPASIGRYYADRIPGMKATFTPADGHFSIVLNHRDAIIDSLVQHL